MRAQGRRHRGGGGAVSSLAFQIQFIIVTMICTCIWRNASIEHYSACMCKWYHG